MEKELDLRIQKTYIALTKSLYEMMAEMPFEEIKVVDICERAMVRKSTFYKHFADKYELLAFMVRRLKDQFDANIYSQKKDIAPVEYFSSFMEQIFTFLNNNRELVNSVMKSSSFPIVINVLSEQAIPDIRTRLKEDRKNGHAMIAEPNFLASFFVGGIMEIVRDWLINDKKENEAAIKEQIANLIDVTYRSANSDTQ